MRMEELRPLVRYARRLTPVTLEGFRSSLLAYDHRLFYGVTGEGELLVADEVYRLRRGDLLYIPAGVEYRYLRFGEGVVLYALNLDLTQAAASRTTPIPPDEPSRFDRTRLIEDTPCAPFHLPLCLSLPAAEETVGRIEEEYRLCRPYYEARLIHLTADLLLTAARAALHRETPRPATLVDRITAYVHEHYTEDCSNARIAAAFSYHPNYLNRLMVEHTGHTLHHYLTRYRIHQAMILLSTTELSVSEIAWRVGIPDLPHFSKTFRRLTGYAPAAFRYKL